MITAKQIQDNPEKYAYQYTAKFRDETIWQSVSVPALDLDGRARLHKEQEAKQLEFSEQYTFPEWRDHGSMVGSVYEK